MKEFITRLINSREKKVTLREIASPKPSRNVMRILGEVLRRANADQQAISQQAHEIRAGN